MIWSAEMLRDFRIHEGLEINSNLGISFQNLFFWFEIVNM